ncbi:MAG: carbohydrate ABC transporter permease [Candidatus Cloacimonadia bacterium]
MMYHKEARSGYLFNLPIIFFAIAFFVVPIVGTIVTSFFQDVTFLPRKFIGLSNYKQLSSDPYFWQSGRFTILFVLVSVTLELVLGMIFALILNEKFRLRGLLRVSILIPWAIPIAISARIWQLIYNYSYGLFNFLTIQLGITTAPINWLGTPIAAFFAIVISDVWKTVPFMTIILLTGLSAIPEVLYKQAMVDGCNFYQRFRYITLPLLKPVVIVALLFRTIDALRIFDLVYVLTGGGPGGTTNSLSLYAYNYFLTGDFGYGSAVSVVIFLLAFILSITYIKLGRFRETMA